MKSRICGNCESFVWSKKDQYMGDCHFTPPILQPSGDRMWTKVYEHDWCSQHQYKGTTRITLDEDIEKIS